MARNAVDVLLLDVGVMTVQARGVCVGVGGEGYFHRLFPFVTGQTLLPFWEEALLLRGKLMTDQAVYVHLRGSHHHRYLMTFVTGLLRGLEDVELDAVAVDTIGRLVSPEEVDLVSSGVNDLQPLWVLAGMAGLADFVFDLRREGDLLGVLRYHFDHVAKALHDTRLMTSVAVDIVHSALIPCLVRRIHEVARRAELWIVLDIIIGEC